MKLVNLTPHPLIFRGMGSGLHYGPREFNLPPSGTVARLEETATVTDTAEGFTFGIDDGTPDGLGVARVELRLGGIVGLPPAPRDYVPGEARTIYVTSALVAAAAAQQGRTDVASPRAVRDDQGRTVAADGLVFHTDLRPSEVRCQNCGAWV